MQATRFDRFATAIAARTPRRTALGWLAGSTLGVALGMVPRPPVGLLPGADRAAARRRRHKKRKKRPCPAGMTASGDGVCGCPAGSVPYAGGCCVPYAGGCCPLGYQVSGGRCCPPGYVPVSGGSCCPRGYTVVCGATSCCPDGSGCCGASCCAAGSGCCGGALCQLPNFHCCTKDCGGPDNPCPLNRAALCPPLETCCFVNNAVGFICCPVGFTCAIDGVSGVGSCVQ